MKLSGMRFFYSVLFSVLALQLISCSATQIARHISDSENIDSIKYPAAPTHVSDLTKTVDVDLAQYKSINRRPANKSDIAVAVAISGGGYRSANLALGVLLEMEKIKNRALRSNLLQEVDYFSTTSGGGLAVGYYLTKLHNHLTTSEEERFSLRNEVDKMLAHDQIAPNPLRADLMKYTFSDDDKKGLEIEKILNDTILLTKEGGLTEGDIFIPKNSSRNAQLPYWIINATVYQDASIFPFAPDVLSRYQVAGFYHKNQYYYFNPPLSHASYYHMPVSVGLMASLSVPYALPPTTFPSYGCSKMCYLQLYDGGIADNLGINTALSLLYQDKRKIKVLIVIDSGKDLLTPFSKLRRPPKDMPLTVRLTMIGSDSYRKYIKSHLRLITQKILCNSNTDNIVTIYLDLEGYKATQHIKSTLTLTLKEQKYLLKIGSELVQRDPTLHAFLAQLARGHLTIGQCSVNPTGNF